MLEVRMKNFEQRGRVYTLKKFIRNTVFRRAKPANDNLGFIGLCAHCKMPHEADNDAPQRCGCRGIITFVAKRRQYTPPAS